MSDNIYPPMPDVVVDGLVKQIDALRAELAAEKTAREWSENEREKLEKITNAARAELAAAQAEVQRLLIWDGQVERDALRAELADVKSALLSVHGRIRLIEKLAGTDPLIIEECHWCLSRIDEALKGDRDE